MGEIPGEDGALLLFRRWMYNASPINHYRQYRGNIQPILYKGTNEKWAAWRDLVYDHGEHTHLPFRIRWLRIDADFSWTSFVPPARQIPLRSSQARNRILWETANRGTSFQDVRILHPHKWRQWRQDWAALSDIRLVPQWFGDRLYLPPLLFSGPLGLCPWRPYNLRVHRQRYHEKCHEKDGIDC